MVSKRLLHCTVGWTGAAEGTQSAGPLETKQLTEIHSGPARSKPNNTEKQTGCLPGHHSMAVSPVAQHATLGRSPEKFSLGHRRDLLHAGQSQPAQETCRRSRRRAEENFSGERLQCAHRHPPTSARDPGLNASLAGALLKTFQRGDAANFGTLVFKM